MSGGIDPLDAIDGIVWALAEVVTRRDDPAIVLVLVLATVLALVLGWSSMRGLRRSATD